MWEIAVVDALYPEKARLLVDDPERPITVPRRCLPEDVQEGDVVRITAAEPEVRRLVEPVRSATDEPPELDVLGCELDSEETQRRRAAMQRLNARLMGREGPQ